MKVARYSLTPKKSFLIIYDILATLFALYFSYFLVATGNLDTSNVPAPLLLLATFVISSALYFFSGLYSQMWLHASIMQYLLVPTAVLVQAIAVSILRGVFFDTTVNFSSYWIYFSTCVFLLTSIRVFYRLFQNRALGFRQRGKLRDKNLKTVRVLIVGAGRAGSRLAEDLKEINGSRYPVAFIDDNPRTHNFKHMGIPVVGGRRAIPTICESLKIDEIILAIPSLDRADVKNIIEICQKTRCRIRILPSVTALTEDKVGFRDVKDIDIDDLLGRAPITGTPGSVSNMLKNKVVLVTGGGGSIGSEICRQVMKCEPKQLIVFDIYENNAYDLQQELWSHYGKDLALTVLIGSVRDRVRLIEVFDQYQPQIVYHAAAHKHVPLMEDSPEEAMKNNVQGTYNVVKTAAEYGAERFVLISTDKAVHPTSVMGASKRLAEMTVLAIGRKFPDLKCAMVRFGNVLGSNGSVVPLFKRQILHERRITVTHPDMRRYFMTIPEAVSLVLQASVYAEHGEIFVLDMGEPVKIIDLAETMIKLSGYEPNVDIPIEFVGLRPGEKMFEELYFDRESLDTTPNEKIMKLRQIDDPKLLSKEIDHLFDMFGNEYPEIKEGILKKLS